MYLKIILYAAVIGISNYLLLSQIVDSTILFLTSFILGLINVNYYSKRKEFFENMKYSTEFVLEFLEYCKNSNDVESNYNLSRIHLKNINFDYAFENIKGEPGLLNKLNLGLLLEPIKAIFSSNNKMIPIENLQEIAKTRLKTIYEANNLPIIKDAIVESAIFMFIFGLIRYIFGDALINNSKLIFRVISDIFYISPSAILTVIFALKGRTKNNEKS